MTKMTGSHRELVTLAAQAEGCTRCPLYEHATQTVFGDGPVRAGLFLIGEQPGDQEDRQGMPFVGPAGRVLDEGLEEAGIDRSHVYVTNAVKHFKWTPRGKRRIHARPNRSEVLACHHWLERELEVVAPHVVIALGATAGQALWGPSFRVGASRGKKLTVGALPAVATIHPSVLLRERDASERARRMDDFVSDLRRADDLRSTG
jgi:DNA polymerase